MHVPLLLNVDEAAKELGISRAKLYSLLAPDGPIANVKIGKSRRIVQGSLVEYVEGLKAGNSASTQPA